MLVKGATGDVGGKTSYRSVNKGPEGLNKMSDTLSDTFKGIYNQQER